jgi:anti-sigma regulatory factor (Ser/Thr protein kinase)
VQEWSVADYTELQPLRSGLRQTLDTQALTAGKELDDMAERMTIVATELATNALNHARSGALVRLSRTRTTFVLDVADDLPTVPPQMAENQPLGEGGRGLAITQELADDIGWYRTDGTKHVWAQFSIPRRVRRFQAPRIPVSGLATLIRLLRRARH